MKVAIPLLLLACLCTAQGHLREKRQSISFGGSRPTDPPPEACNDYADRQGLCDVITACPALLRLVQSQPSPQDIQNVRRSICGFKVINFRRVPKLCCAQAAGNQPTKPTPTPTPSPTPAPTSKPTQSGGSGFNGAPENHPNRRLLPQQCGFSFTPRIVGGQEVALGEFPWLAILGYEVAGTDEVDFNCGGTLINDRYVLTAAHCVTNLPAGFNLAKVRLGEHDLTTAPDCRNKDCAGPVQDFNIEEIISHADYNKPNRFWNDIALLRLDRPFDRTLGSFIENICMPFDSFRTDSLTDKKLVVAGFGLTEAFGDSSNVLMKLQVPLVSNERCATVFRRQRANIGDLQMCAGAEKGRDSCSGDSGGPLMAFDKTGPPYRVVGVVSFGVTRCGTENVPGVYTRVSQYLNWIMDHMRD